MQVKGRPKVNFDSIEVGSNIAQNHSHSPKEVISGHYLFGLDHNTNKLKCNFRDDLI